MEFLGEEVHHLFHPLCNLGLFGWKPFKGLPICKDPSSPPSKDKNPSSPPGKDKNTKTAPKGANSPSTLCCT